MPVLAVVIGFGHGFYVESNKEEFYNNLWWRGVGQKLTGSEETCFNSQWVHNSEALIQIFVSACHRSLLQAACSLVIYRWHRVASTRVSRTGWMLFLLLPLMSLPASGPAFPLAFCGMMPGKIDIHLLKERSVEEFCHMNPHENPWVQGSCLEQVVVLCCGHWKGPSHSSFLASLAMEFVVSGKDELQGQGNKCFVVKPCHPPRTLQWPAAATEVGVFAALLAASQCEALVSKEVIKAIWASQGSPTTIICICSESYMPTVCSLQSLIKHKMHSQWIFGNGGAAENNPNPKILVPTQNTPWHVLLGSAEPIPTSSNGWKPLSTTTEHWTFQHSKCL